MKIIDLSQEIYHQMPVYKVLPQVKVTMHASHEQWNKEKIPKDPTPSVYKLEMSEHTGTHVDALNHMRKEDKGKSIDKMPLENFYTEGICLDFSHKKLKELITSAEIKEALKSENLVINKGDTVLFYTNHYKNYFETDSWKNGPGLTAEATRWLGNQKIAAFGVETMSPGVTGVSNREVHHICGELDFTHYENMINLDQLIGLGRFRFIAFPLKIKGGTGSPVRAVAIFDETLS
ncbi:cyclase family protein [Mesonia sp.]|uniref:cyclase family protein n=1 Tax=Mesonia sp. TaxID=1960830 RepID=UPI001775FBFF|nr:cyclase family protein [Mesonia sp.]HIB38594.1 cyclase family protein [Mesonia sp.]HIO28095.1 cyclase family protein [Flavobacteriaceae bacterium]